MKHTPRTAQLAAVMLAAAGLAGGFAQPSPQEQANVGATAKAQTRGTQAGASLSRAGERNAVAKALLGGFGRQANRSRWPGQGWSVRQGQRMARKRNNQARNRKAHR